MKNFAFRQYKRTPKEDPREPTDPTDKDSAAYLKRREQVRRAQRTHRERKENYIKSLENEVVQLRTSESRILQETRNLYAEISRLKQLLDRHGIPHGSSEGFSTFSPQNEFTPPSTSTSVSFGILSNPHRQQQLHVVNPSQLGGSSGGSEFYLTESEASGSQGHRSRPKKKKSFFRARKSDSDSLGDISISAPVLGADINAIAAAAEKLSLRDMDQTNVGVEFVLTLEAPCLHHTQGDPKQPQEPSGHALTATAPVLFQSPSQPVNTTDTSSNQQWDTPGLSLETLLNLSTNIELTDEITPVQAWHQIRSHPDFESVQIPDLRRLTEDLRKHVKCYGFGAVIETGIFASLYANLFPNGGFNFGF